MGGVRGKAPLAGHHVVGTAKQLVEGIQQRAHFRRYAIGIQRLTGIRVALAQRAGQLFQRRQLAAQQHDQQQKHHRQRD